MDASLKETILGLCEAPKRGGRLVSNGGGGKLVLYDCGSWTDMHTEALRARYPEVELDVLACGQSLSGFAIEFRVREAPALSLPVLLIWLGFVVALFIALLMNF